VIVADPSATEVTSPADDTVAMDEFDVVQVTVAPDMVLSAASFTVAVIWVVSDSERNVRLNTESVTDAAA
tara:strand:+ start:250 stop:459 length:210 start_codon:yes stop_codon:yes gene_type:complete